MMNQLERALASDLIWATLVNRIKVGDRFEFENSQLLSVIRQQRYFDAQELTRLLDSPITLRKYRHLLAVEQHQHPAS